MTSSPPRRIARVRPLDPVFPDEFFFVANDSADFSSEEGRRWTVTSTPFSDSRQNQPSPGRRGWVPGDVVAEEYFRFLAPAVPANVFGMAHNSGEAGRDLPPQAFHKASTSVIGPDDAIQLSAGAGHVEPEAELTVVIGRRARSLTLNTARSAVLGLTIANDVTARTLQQSDELWISAKSQDTFTPAGPWIVTGLDDRNLEVGIVHNGQPLGTATTANLGWKVDEILVYLSSFMTLHPGDLVLTGFPAESRRIHPGDTVVCRVEGIGELCNPVTSSAPELQPVLSGGLSAAGVLVTAQALHGCNSGNDGG